MAQPLQQKDEIGNEVLHLKLENLERMLISGFESSKEYNEVKFSSMKETLASIDAQTKKTNGRVLKLEENVYNLQLNEAMHGVNCPHSQRMKDIENEIASYKSKMSEDLQEYNFFKKYPKLSITIIAIVVITMLSGIIQISDVVKSNFGSKPATVETVKK